MWIAVNLAFKSRMRAKLYLIDFIIYLHTSISSSFFSRYFRYKNHIFRNAEYCIAENPRRIFFFVRLIVMLLIELANISYLS